MTRDILLSPFQIGGGLVLPNRFVMAPMTRSRSPGGTPGADVASYYARRASAGVSLIITEGTAINRPGASDDPVQPAVPHFWGDAALAGWKTVVDDVHAAGGRIMPQLWHVGATASRRAQWLPDDPRIESPSGLSAPSRPLGRVMTDGDISDTIDAYAAAAGHAHALGFDGVEIHGAHGYLIDQFLWSPTNLRNDRYGGDTAAERASFAVEIVRAIRRETGPAFPISFRFSQFKQQDYSAVIAHTPHELETILGPLSDAGVDLFHASQRRFWEPAFPENDLNLAGWAKRVTGKPAITVGSIGLDGEFIGNFSGEVSRPAALNGVRERLERGEFDLVAVGRAILNDPHWVQKIAEGRTAELMPFDIAALDRLY